jgi:adenylate cyclase
MVECQGLLLWVPTRALLPLAVVGLPIGWALGFLEVVVFPALVQWLPLRAAVFLQGIGHLLLVPIVYVVAVVMTSLLRQLLQGMSRQRLRELLNGRYQQPEAENRIFLFIDLKDSTHLAETLGNDRYSRLVRDFFRDVSPAIAAARGEVY